MGEIEQNGPEGTTSAGAAALAPEVVVLPAPTVWPLVLSLGITLLAAGLLTHPALSVVGLVLFFLALRGWVAELLPGKGEAVEPLRPLAERARPIEGVSLPVQPLRPGMVGHRMRIPERVHPYSAGAKGGAYGGLAMVAVALAYGLISGRGIWFPINLLAAMVVPGFRTASVEDLQHFSTLGLVCGVLIHAVGSVGAGLLFGLLLPMLPRRPILWGGVVAPLLWSGALYGLLGILDPLLSQHVDWFSFIVAQFTYGIVVGWVVVGTEKVHSTELWGGTATAGPRTSENAPATPGEPAEKTS